jgi:hypothetical protein
VSGNRFGHVLGALITLVAISPFLWALSLRRVAIEQVIILMQQRKYRPDLYDDPVSVCAFVVFPRVTAQCILLALRLH